MFRSKETVRIRSSGKRTRRGVMVLGSNFDRWQGKCGMMKWNMKHWLFSTEGKLPTGSAVTTLPTYHNIMQGLPIDGSSISSIAPKIGYSFPSRRITNSLFAASHFLAKQLDECTYYHNNHPLLRTTNQLQRDFDTVLLESVYPLHCQWLLVDGLYR